MAASLITPERLVKPDVHPNLRVTFRVSVPVRMTGQLLQHDRLWGDQLKPPPPVAHRYVDPPEPYYMTWPPRRGPSDEDGPTAQERRLKAALFMVGDLVKLDQDRCRFTYHRCTLVGSLELRDDEQSRRRRWTGYGTRSLAATDALGTVLLVLRCALRNVYEVRPPEHGTISDIPLPGLSITLCEKRA